ncbi:hypothetical protein LTS10_012065 [Elasticomyces elasticus]|nr:hypothetical protein LTS10_012065 [Elasticomyces elasticus]
MAPQQPTKHSRASLSAKNPRGIYAPPTSTSTNSTSTSTSHAATTSTPHDAADGEMAGLEMAGFESFKTNKKDKRTIRHQSLLSRVRESGVRKKVLKRRRPLKKLGGLGSGMAGLSDALPQTESKPRRAMDLGSGSGGDMEAGEEEWDGVSEDEATSVPLGLRRGRGMAGTGIVEGGQRMKLSSVKHKPGAARRKAVMEGLERERMGRNLAGMAGNPTKETEVGSGAGEKDRWAALRKFIGGTMEKREVA